MTSLPPPKGRKLNSGELSSAIAEMSKDGFSPSEIAANLGYDPKVVNAFLTEKIEVGSPEQILQEALRTVVSLIPIADIEYRSNPKQSMAQALTSLIDSSRNLITDIYALKNKEDTYRHLNQKVLEPFCREMIKSMLNEIGQLNSFEGKTLSKEDLERVSRNMGKKFNENFRKAREDLGETLGVNAEARARINMSTGSS